MTVVKIETRDINTYREFIKAMEKDGFITKTDPHSIEDKLFKATFTKVEQD